MDTTNSIRSFPQADQYIIICQEEFVIRYSFKKKVEQYLPNCRVLTVDSITEGQACTCLLAEHFIESEDPLTISSCDYQLVYDETMYDELRNDVSVDVIIWTFQIGQIVKKDPNAFAYCRTEGSQVIEVVEKQTISETPHLDPAVVGTFTYRQFQDFVEGAQKTISKNIRVNNEFYVGTSINQLIEAGKKVVCFPVEKFISFGDPFELNLYQYWVIQVIDQALFVLLF